MLVMQWTILVLCAAVSVRMLAGCACIVRAGWKRRLLARGHGLANEAPDGAGISILCSGVRSRAQLENLLASEYACCEVVAVLDARFDFAEFDAILSHYRMIRVNYLSCGELPVSGVRGLYRSRQRGYRRLVVVDRMRTTPFEDFDAAAEVAVYDYLLPVEEDCRLLPGAVERLAAEIASVPRGALELVRCRLAEPTLLVSRETVLREGGFSRKTGRSVRRKNRRTLYEPLLYRPAAKSRTGTGRTGLAGVSIAAACGLCAWCGAWTMAAVCATALVVWSACLLSVELLAGESSLRINFMTSWWCRLRKHSV